MTYKMRMILNMRLWELPTGKQAHVETLMEDLPGHYRVRLSELGFREGEPVSCLRWTPFGGPRIYQIGDGVFSLAKDVACSIQLKDMSL